MVVKLVRDRMDQIPWTDETAKQHIRYAHDDQEHRNLLDKKLLEEVAELLTEVDRDKRLAELADIVSVLKTYAIFNGYSWNQVLDAEASKTERRGGFTGGLVYDVG